MKNVGPFLFILYFLFPAFPAIHAQQTTEIVDLNTELFPLITMKVQFPGRNEVKRYVSESNTDVFESGLPQQFTIDCPIDQISFAILLDKSLSMAFKPNDPNPISRIDPDSVRWRSAKSAIKAFAQSLVPPDSACLISFSRVATLGQDFTDDAGLIANAVDSISLEEYTGTWVACKLGIDLLKVRPGRRIIILLNDGGENVYRTDGGPTYNDVVVQANQHNIVIHTIGLGEFNGTQIIENLSQATGGKFFLSADGSDLSSIYSDIIASITAVPCDVSYQAEEFCPDGSLRTIQIESKVGPDVFQADTMYHSPFNLESTTITTQNPTLVFPNEEFSVEMEFETYLRPDEPTEFSASFRFDNTAVDFLRIESDSGIFVEQPPSAKATDDGILEITGRTSIYSPQNKYLFTLYFKAKEIKSATVVSASWLNIDVVRKCHTVSDAALFTFAVDGLCDKIVRRRTPPVMQSVYPNPAREQTNVVLEFQNEYLMPVTLSVTNQNGEVLHTLLNGLPPAGTMSLRYDTHNLPSGAYWVELRMGDIVESKKLVVTR